MEVAVALASRPLECNVANKARYKTGFESIDKEGTDFLSKHSPNKDNKDNKEIVQ